MIMPFNFGNIIVLADVVDEIGQMAELNFGEIVAAMKTYTDAVGVVTPAMGTDSLVVPTFLDGAVGFNEMVISDALPSAFLVPAIYD